MNKNESVSSGLCGNKWLPICFKCHAEVKECCIDVELTLFPDEIQPFINKDPDNVKEYNDDTFGYEKDGKCCFLTTEYKCELQENNIKKPLDCLIFPLNYKEGKAFIDNSCWGKHLIDKGSAISYLREKLKKFSHYKKVSYEISDSDEFIMDLPMM